MKKIVILLLLLLGAFTTNHSMEQSTDLETEIFNFESLPSEVRHFIFTLFIQDYFNSCDDILELYDDSLLRKALVSFKLVSRSFFTFSDEELQKLLTISKKNRLGFLEKLIREEYDLPAIALDHKLIDTLSPATLKEAATFIIAGANINLKGGYTSATALICAAEDGNTKMVQLLLGHNVDIDLKDNCCHTALMYAAENGHTKIVQLLLEHKADPNLKDEFYRTALMYTSEKGHVKIVQLLIGHNADTGLKDMFGKTALNRALKNGHTEVAHLLKSKNNRCTLQ